MTKDKLIESLANESLDGMGVDDLMDFFYGHQIDYLESLTDSELKEHIDIYSDMDTYEEYFTKGK